MKQILLPLILLASLFFRIYDLKNVPSGLYWDEQDTSYQAYSLLSTGRDYFGNFLPLFPHSFADFRTPVNIYFTVPLVKLFGLTYLPSRLTAVIFGFLTLPIVFYLTGKRYLPLLFLAFSPWHFLFSRYNGEITSMLFFIFTGLLLFYRKKPILSLIFFILSIASYSPAKFFTPILVLYLFRLKFRYLFLFIILCLPLLISTVGSSRFHDLAIFTDPQLANTVDYQRKLRLLSRDSTPDVGSSPTFADKLFVNKFTILSNTFIRNYLSNFSTEFLFLTGDRNLRHSTGLGQLYPIDALLLIIGFICISRHKNRMTYLIILMLIIAPIPSALTRDGFSHAGRSALLLIPFTLLIASFKFPKFLLPLYLIPIAFFLQNFYSYYRLTSPLYFDYGYDQAVDLAKASEFPQVWLDFHNDSPLMSYLFYAKVPPGEFQKSLPLKAVDLGQGISAYKFGNIFTLLPGERNYNVQSPPKETLVIAKTEKKPALISYPDGSPEFQLFIFN